MIGGRIVKVTRNYQVTIPKAVRESAGIGEGDYLEVSLDGEGRIVMRKVRRDRKKLRLGRKLTPEEIEKIVRIGLGASLD